VAEQHFADAVDVKTGRERPCSYESHQLVRQLLRAPPDSIPERLGNAFEVVSAQGCECRALAIAVNEGGWQARGLQQLQALAGHGTGQDITPHDDGVHAGGGHVCKNSLEGRQVAVDVVQCGDSLHGPAPRALRSRYVLDRRRLMRVN
jgi:hypothetical protein